MHDPLVFNSRQLLMQRVADRVRAGYVHWTSGEVLLERAPILVRKFARLYGTDVDRNSRVRAKLRGDGNAALLLAQYGEERNRLVWFLLVSPGDNPAHQLERMCNASTKEGRVHHGGYELVYVAKPGVRHPVLTWRMQKAREEAWRDSALAAARHGNPHEVELFLSALYRSAGFYGVRRQVGKVVALFRHEWRRRRGSQKPPPLRALYYCSRLPNKGTRLSRLVRDESGPTRVQAHAAGVDGERDGSLSVREALSGLWDGSHRMEHAATMHPKKGTGQAHLRASPVQGKSS